MPPAFVHAVQVEDDRAAGHAAGDLVQDGESENGEGHQQRCGEHARDDADEAGHEASGDRSRQDGGHERRKRDRREIRPRALEPAGHGYDPGGEPEVDQIGDRGEHGGGRRNCGHQEIDQSAGI